MRVAATPVGIIIAKLRRLLGGVKKAVEPPREQTHPSRGMNPLTLQHGGGPQGQLPRAR